MRGRSYEKLPHDRFEIREILPRFIQSEQRKPSLRKSFTDLEQGFLFGLFVDEYLADARECLAPLAVVRTRLERIALSCLENGVLDPALFILETWVELYEKDDWRNKQKEAREFRSKVDLTLNTWSRGTERLPTCQESSAINQIIKWEEKIDKILAEPAPANT